MASERRLLEVAWPVALLLFGTVNGYADVTSGRVGYYRFNGDARDESGFNNHATVNGAVQFVQGRNDGAAFFDNDWEGTQWIELPTSGSLDSLGNSSFTVAVLYKSTDETGVGGALLGSEVGSSPHLNMQYNDGSHANAYARVGDGVNYYLLGYETTDPAAITIDGEYHWQIVVLNREAHTATEYVGSTAIETKSFGTLGRCAISGLVVGAGSSSDRRYSARQTTVDELRIYNRALTASDIGELVGSPCSAPGSFAHVSPANGSSQPGSSVRLQWSASTGASTYDVYFGTNSNPTSRYFNTANSYLDVPISADTTYYWKVVARGSCADTPSSSGVWSFRASPVPCPASRDLPSGYTVGYGLQVAIAVTAPSGTSSYAVEDSPPSTWTVSGIDNGGVWDSANRKVKWGPFFDAQARTLRYTATPPQGTDGSKCFSGAVSIDGASQAICGDSCIERITCQPHPADTSDNFRLDINEVTAYGSAWKQGQTWSRPPNPIPIDYVTNAGLIWKSGEVYHCDATANPPWRPGASSLLGCGTTLSALAGTASSSFNPASYTPGQGVAVSITASPDSATQVYAVEDTPPLGWAVSGIDNGGQWDPTNAKVKWGPFFDNQARTLAYTATPPAGESGSKTFAGVVSFDGASVAIGGARSIERAGSSQYSHFYWLPVASHASGANNSQWRTDLGLLNAGGSTSNFELRFTSGGTVRTNTAYVPAGSQSILADVVGQLGASGSGSVEVRSDQPLKVTSRTYNQSSSGTFGQNYPSYLTSEGLAAGQSALLPQLTEDSSYRCNVALTNIGTTTASVRVELFDGAGGKLTEYTVSLQPAEWKQENQPFRNKAGQTAMSRGYAKVTVLSGSGVIATASVIDGSTNDPTTVEMIR